MIDCCICLLDARLLCFGLSSGNTHCESLLVQGAKLRAELSPKLQSELQTTV